LHRSTKLTKLIVYAIAIDWHHAKGSQLRSRIAKMTSLRDWRLKPLTISAAASSRARRVEMGSRPEVPRDMGQASAWVDCAAHTLYRSFRPGRVMKVATQAEA